MTRLRADLVLLLVAIIWGSAFVAQKSGMEGSIGPFSFIWLRFALSLVVVFPFLLREIRNRPPVTRKTFLALIPVCLVFAGGIVFQQIGMVDTSVTNAGFITGLYVIFTPFIGLLLFRKKPGLLVWPACLLTVAGLWYLNGGSMAALNKGDLLVLGCAVFFAFHVALTGWFLAKEPRPLLLVTSQYLLCVAIALAGGLTTETLTFAAVRENWIAIGFAGVISGGIAYTLQAVTQQYTPPSDAAIIMSGESVFAAITGVLILGETLGSDKLIGCAFIMAAILCVEAGVLIKPKPGPANSPGQSLPEA